MVKLSDHDGVDDNGYKKKKDSLPSQLRYFTLSQSKNWWTM